MVDSGNVLATLPVFPNKKTLSMIHIRGQMKVIVQLNLFINGKLFETSQEYRFPYFLAVTTSQLTFFELIFP